MKKYLSLLVPLAFCGGLALYFSLTPPRVDQDGYGYDHTYLAFGWAIIGAASTILLGCCLGLSDATEYFQRRSHQRAIERQFGKR